MLEECLTLASEVYEEKGKAEAHSLAAQIALNQGDTARARSLIQEILTLSRARGWREDMVESLIMLGQLSAVEGDAAAAQACYEESLAVAREMGFKRVIPAGLEGLAVVVATQGEPVWAARLWGAAEALRETIGAPLPPVYRTEYEHAVAAAGTHLGERAFTTAWAEGRTMTPEQVLAMLEQPSTPEPVPTAKPSPPPIYPNDLTEREVEVLRLLAQGLTNAQLAEQLILSPYTVHAHVRSIFSKLGVTSRSAATRFAFEQKLV